MKKIFLALLLLSGAFCDGAVLEITKENFSEIENATKPLILDVNAKWCGPCRKMGKIFDEVSEKYGDEVIFAKMDFDAQGQYAEQFGVTLLPTLLFFKPGEPNPVMRSIGLLTQAEFEQKINEFLKS